MLVVGAKHEYSRRENEKKPVGCMPLFTFGVEVSHPSGVKKDYDSEANEVNRSLYLLKKNKKKLVMRGQFQGVAWSAKRLQTSCDSANRTMVRVTMDHIWKDLLTLLKAGR